MNPNAIIFIAFAAIIGALCGSILTGLAIGLGLCLIGTIIAN